MDVFTNNTEEGVLLQDRARPADAATIIPVTQIPVTQANKQAPVKSENGRAPVGLENDRNSHRLAFAGLFLFTLVLYLRPNDLFPGLLGAFPVARLVGLFTLLVYAGSKLSVGERLTIWPLEMKMLALLVLLAVVHVPFAYSRANSLFLLTDTFLKVAIVFALMINLLDSRKRLYSILRLVVICGTAVALG